MFEIILLFISIVVYIDFIYPQIYRAKSVWNKCSPPPIVRSWPIGIPFTINLLKSLRKETLMSDLKEKHLPMKFKTFMQESTFKYVMYTRDPVNIKAILSTQFHDFGVYERSQNLSPIFGTGIFTTDNSKWKHSRLMLRPQFNREQIGRLNTLLLHIDCFINAINGKNGNVELKGMMHMLTMDTATHLLFGESVGMLSGGSQRAIAFVDAYTFLNEYAMKKFMLNSMRFLLPLVYPRYKKSLKTCNEFIDFYVENAFKNRDNCTEDYVFAYELARKNIDPKEIRSQLFNILIAGRDTTASTLSFAFYYFALIPSMWERCRLEVETLNGEITYESLRKLKFMSKFIKEVLRLHPVVPVNTREAVRDTKLPVGGGRNHDMPVFIPKGMAVNYSVYVMHRDPDIYGKDADEFNPDRWDSEVRGNLMHTTGYLPFNAGPRICLGQQFALTEMMATIARLAQEFKYVLRGEKFPTKLREKNGLTLVIGGDLDVRFTNTL